VACCGVKIRTFYIITSDGLAIQVTGYRQTYASLRGTIRIMELVGGMREFAGAPDAMALIL
jgi:hypothetical protein